jgi:ubiquinone/menaquinone biosynthesis C-methylase UbiE
MEIANVYGKISNRYHERAKLNFYNAELEYPSMLRILEKLELSNKKILDLGCGSGRYTKILLSKGANVWGIDPSEKMLGIARKENRDVIFKKGWASKIPFKSNFFDIAIASLCLDHERDIEKAFKEVNRVLKKRGIFLFSRNNPITEVAENVKGNHHTFNNYFREGKRKKYFPSFKVNMPYYHITLETLIKAIIMNGFVIENYIDVKPNPSSKSKFPNEYESTINKPYFCIFKIRKTKFISSGISEKLINQKLKL